MRNDETFPERRVEATEDGSRTLFDPSVRQSFHSRHGALAEARHVFLEASGVAERLANGRGARVLEVGFGSGLNFLLTADAAVEHGARLEYRALERRLPTSTLLRQLEHGRHLRHPELAEALIAARARFDDEAPLGPWAPELPGVALTLELGDATAATLERSWADAVYHDAFSPSVNPELWSATFLQELVAALAPGGRLVTYSVQGEVRRRLAALGLSVEKRPGPPGGKREALVATRPSSPEGLTSRE